ncbi:MAG: KH domain-containing protein [Clostridiales bacterium]|nr:KH domain-containing protein [Clostridiales bacterium]
MKELLTVIAKHLVDDPDQVSVKDYMDDDALILELHVSDDDMGKVIGKQGRIAKAIRTVIKAAAIYEDKKVAVKIMQ